MDSKDRDYMITAGELSSILAHEIKNPMNSIIINMEVLRNTIIELTKASPSPLSDKAQRYLDTIEGEIRRLDKVIKGFLDFATPPQQIKIKFKLNPVIQTIAEFVKHELEQHRIELSLQLQSDLPAIMGSPDHIKQALLNLVLNAMQALPGGGKISILSEIEGSNIAVTVADSGQGISTDLHEKIFTPYYTTKAKGSGLGLTIVRRVIKEHLGDIKLESSPERGTRFKLLFPMIAEKM